MTQTQVDQAAFCPNEGIALFWCGFWMFVIELYLFLCSIHSTTDSTILSTILRLKCHNQVAHCPYIQSMELYKIDVIGQSLEPFINQRIILIKLH